MAETQLISLDDVQEYRQVDPKYDVNRFNTYVNSVQRRNLRDLLGDAMYYAFMEDDRSSGKYKELLDGKTYAYSGDTITYYGLKPALCFWVLALMARESDMYMAEHGAITFVDNPQQNFQSAKSNERTAQLYMEEATSYANEIIKYIGENSSTYTLWESEAQVNESSITSFKA